jgi:hypothetical protein
MGGRSWGRRDSGPDHHGRGRRHHGGGHHGGGHHGGGHHSHSGNHHRRSVSTSSSSSSSSSYSSDSVSSVGSLPAYENLKDQQIPTTRQALEDWLDHPDQSITKGGVRKMCQEIKASKHADPVQHQQDMTNLRNEVRELMKAFRESKKTQKRERRILKRERRSARKEARKQNRQLKKDERHAHRKGRKGKDIDNGTDGSSRPFPPFGIAGRFAAMKHANSNPGETSSLTPSVSRGFAFGRTISETSNSCPRSPRVPRGDLTGPSALHGTWPFTQGTPYAPGNISMPSFGKLTSVSRSAEQIHTELLEVSSMADDREARAVELRVAVTIDGISEKAKLKMMGEAMSTEEEAWKYRREADRLRAEGQLLDSEIAKELAEGNVQNGKNSHNVQVTGFISS